MAYASYFFYIISQETTYQGRRLWIAVGVVGILGGDEEACAQSMLVRETTKK